MGFSGGISAAALSELILKSMELKQKLECSGCQTCTCGGAPSPTATQTVYRSPITISDRLFVGAMAFVAGWNAETIARTLAKVGVLPVAPKAGA